MKKKVLFLLLLIGIGFFLGIKSRATAQSPTLVGLPPACDGGIAIDNINFVNGKFQVIAGTTVKLMAYGISDPDGIVSNVNFRFKSVNDLTCPSSGDGSLIQGQVIHTTDINAVDVWTIMWDTSGVPTGDYNVWASPVDNIGNSCSGNPAANGGNNYCGTNGLCVNCKTVANLSDPCPRGSLGNLNCSANGCINIDDFNLFQQKFGLSTSAFVVLPGEYTADLVFDNTQRVDTADYEILRQNFNTSCTP